ESVECESFARGLLDYPHYTRPAEYRALKTPEVLLSGNHAEIERWRRRKAIEKTVRRRPDLIRNRSLSQDEQRDVEEILKEIDE
ncbi:MAG TPA: tRNA (guanosine(37)-N1)-methyltransferase TrmD, partial [Blastocatellia bacterium]|nr:tRNA (guanosine(37)-N1)-methyltransferase TrmD [Blastocatellia bacterium]